jgi:hypothetical protein
MQTVSPGRYGVVRERACVLYDRSTGAIRHIQHVIVMEGGHDPDDHEIEAMCRRALTKRGRAHDALDTLHVDRDAFQPFKVYRVDPGRRVLVEREHKRQTPMSS